jgi:hypothetical protein
MMYQKRPTNTQKRPTNKLSSICYCMYLYDVSKLYIQDAICVTTALFLCVIPAHFFCKKRKNPKPSFCVTPAHFFQNVQRRFRVLGLGSLALEPRQISRKRKRRKKIPEQLTRVSEQLWPCVGFWSMSLLTYERN